MIRTHRFAPAIALSFALTPALLPTPGAAQADAPRVVADIAPIHSLVAQVMDGIGAPELIVPPGSDAHQLALRPSDARRLSEADVVIWVGPTLTPWMTDPLATLAPTAATLSLLDVQGWTTRAATAGDAHDHGAEDGDAHGADHADVHDDHGDHGDHDDHAGDHADDNADDHGDEHADDHGGDHAAALDESTSAGIDPHAWLDPEVAIVWVRAISSTLSDTDPDNAARYAANAEAAVVRLTDLHDRIDALLADVPGGTWLAPHAAFGYFEDRFNLPSASAVADSDAQAPGPAHLSDLRARVIAGEITCVLTETNAATDFADLLTDGTEARTAALDDTGMSLTPGPALYDALLDGIAATLKSCITAP